MKTEIEALLKSQQQTIIDSNYSKQEACAYIFENDVVEKYLRDNDISEADVDLESLRDLQFTMLNSL